MFSLADLFDKVVANSWHGSLESLTGEKLTLSHCEEALALLKQESLGLINGDRIVVRAHSDIFTVAVMLAAWRLGLAVVPVKGDASEAAVQSVASDCNAKVIFKDGDVVSLETYRSEQRRFEFCAPPEVTGVDLALIIYTSGSTGRPKGIMLTHQNVLTSLESITEYLRLTEQDRILCLSPLSFDYGLYQVLFALYKECTTVLYDKPFNPVHALKALSENKITILPIVPAMGAALVKLVSLVKPDLSLLKSITNTGGHLSEYVIRAWKEYCPQLNVFSMYGLTECKRAMYLEPELWEEKMGSVGKPVPGLDARIFQYDSDADSYREVAENEVGELYVRGSAVMQAYYDPNAQGGATIVHGLYRDDNWLATGDLFSRDNEGFYYFKGRSKDLIKQAGFCLFPKDLENLIDACPQVHLNVVMGSKDKFQSEIAVCVVELHENTPENQQQFKVWLKENLDVDYTPREIKFAESIQLTANSKVDRKLLQQEFQA
ncbi:2-succinylbenzoate--CoA ligase [Microbulbifer sp. NBRC 101763]|uniref:class I adenylate-forming enzyme family protein n=1 Tax=unclassified Microbulbifer TaxID=2619833 RepID=UPI0024AD4C43|nr:class I adenylate-forming enzyme family protein [Microbulbifer sp. MLAF003]WHI49618.1 class I adenylate-forming enzyme family protein [Microbulbifer sp. MLAF003]